MKHILFVGNSFTYYNDLPAVFARLCAAAGHDISVGSVFKGGWYLSRYADAQDEMGAVLRSEYPTQPWDLIIWQDQSFNPVGDRANFLAAAKELCTAFPARSGHAFFQTWAYEDQSEKLSGTNLTYDEMHDGLKYAYMQAARENGAICVPVGDAFSLCYHTRPDIALYVYDHFHPNHNGTYLAACTFYACLMNESPLALITPEMVQPDAAAVLRQIAHDVWQAR